MDHGAHYFKVDLQVHTPRDKAWVGTRPVTQEEREQYARQFVAACREKGLDAVAITDHHDFALFPYIKEAASHELDSQGEPIPHERRLVVFPGLELTLSVPCQALLILDADFPVDRLGAILEVLAISAVDPALPNIGDVESIGHIDNLKQLQEKLDLIGWLKGAYIILPNVTDGGHGTLMRKGMHEKYRQMPFVGGYIDGDKKIGEGNARIFAGGDAKWGNKRIALVRTSDSRSESYEALGKHATWIKWAVPTAEALRQACLAQESRIATSQPLLPSIVVTRLSVSNSRFMGPIELGLNPQYNAIIGGRGTGKSTCLEYMRWALCDEPKPQQADDDTPDHAARRHRLISQTLAPFESHVDVHLLINGIAHVVRRHARTGDVLLKVGPSEFQPATPVDIRSLMPVQAYSQRQLSSVGVRLDEITSFVTAPIRDALEDLGLRQTELASEIRESHAVLQRARTLSRTIARDSFTVDSLTQQAAEIRKGLAAVSDADRECLERKPNFDTGDELVSGWQRKTGQAQAEVKRFGDAMRRLGVELRSPNGTDLPHQADLEDLERELRQALVEIEGLADQAEQALKLRVAPGSKIGDLFRSWQRRREEFEAQYAGAKERSSAHTSQLKELEELEARRRSLQGGLDGQREELTGIEDAAGRHEHLLARWRELQAKRSGMLGAECQKLTDSSDGLIRASIRKNAGMDRLHDGFRSAITGSGVRSAKIDSFLEAISAADDPLLAWHAAMDELEALVVSLDDPGTSDTDVTTALRTFSEAELGRIMVKLGADAVGELRLVPMEDHPSFEYRTKDGEYIPFEVASAGQQATALLRVLLNQSGPPLIIDQPEDDLDSQVILSVVDQIWEAKRRRQLIFSSHNANLVVNGDAELVVCCDYRAAGDQSGGKIKLEGAIDVPSVRAEITVVMEGGERAFRLRQTKYGF